MLQIFGVQPTVKGGSLRVYFKGKGFLNDSLIFKNEEFAADHIEIKCSF